MSVINCLMIKCQMMKCLYIAKRPCVQLQGTGAVAESTATHLKQPHRLSQMSENNKNHMTTKLLPYSENKRQVQKILDATCIRITIKKNVKEQGRYTAQLNPSALTQCASFV